MEGKRTIEIRTSKIETKNKGIKNMIRRPRRLKPSQRTQTLVHHHKHNNLIRRKLPRNNYLKLYYL